MKQDKDLMFLASCQNDDLRALCDILTYNNKGEIRLSEQLTDSDAYLNCYPDRMNLMTAELAEELRKFGSNTVRTICRKVLEPMYVRDEMKKVLESMIAKYK